jgi:hypothetical protein
MTPQKAVIARSGATKQSRSPASGFGEREVEVAIDFVGFTIGDVFVVGYGTDYTEKYRHLPYIGVVE